MAAGNATGNVIREIPGSLQSDNGDFASLINLFHEAVRIRKSFAGKEFTAVRKFLMMCLLDTGNLCKEIKLISFFR
jgi:hypothetical protein